MIGRSFGVHDGTFHADDVSACALLLLFDQIDEDKIFRTRDPDVLERCEFVCDVGGIYDASIKRFDHHQIEYSGRLSSAGMILIYLKDQKVITEDLYHFLNQNVITGVDEIDNGLITPKIGHSTFSSVVSSFVPVSYDADQEELFSGFMQAVSFVIAYFKRLQEKFEYMQGCKGYVEEIMESKESLLIFEKPIPWLDAFFDNGGVKHPAKYLVMPTGIHWKLRGIPPNIKEKMKVRLPLPANWAGLSDKDLEKQSGIEGSIFCHKGLFISIWETKEAALEAAEKALSGDAK